MVGVLAILMGIGFIGFLISTYPVQSLLLVGIAVAIVAWLLVLRNSARKKQVTEQQMPPILLRPRVSRTCYCLDAGRTSCVRDANSAADCTHLYCTGHSKRDDRA